MKKFVKVRLTNLDSALFYAERANELALKEADSVQVTTAENALGWAFQQKGDFNKSVEHYSKGLEIARNNNLIKRQKYLLNNLGLLHYDYGKFDDALDYHLESLKIRETQGNRSDKAIACNNIGLVYYQIKNYQLAIEYFEKSVDLKGKGDIDQAATLVNLGLCYTAIEEHDKALSYYNRVLRSCNENCEVKQLIEANIGASMSHFQNEEYDSAEMKLNRAKYLAEQNEVNERLIVILAKTASIRLVQNRYKEATQLVNQSQQIAKELNSRVFIRNNYQLYANIHADEKDFEKAYYYQVKFDSLNNEILNEEVIANLAQLQADFQERENIQKIAEHRDEISKQTTLLIGTFVILGLISIILFILSRSNEARKKANKELAEAKDIIEQKNAALTDVNSQLEEKVKERTKELIQTNEALSKSNADLDNFIYKTSHDIRGPLATLQGMCNVALMDIDEPQAVDYFSKIGLTARNLNEILSKLLIINQINNATPVATKIEFEPIIDNIVSECKKIPGKDLSVSTHIENGIDFQCDEALIQIILNNLINNAFKFYKRSERVKSFVDISILGRNGHLEMHILDNGIGIDEKSTSKIFEIFSKASEVSDTAGLGLYLVKLATERLNGDVKLTRTPKGNTKFLVELPMAMTI